MFEIRAEPGFDFLSPEYRRLFAESEATAFQHPLWLDRLYGQLAPAVGAEPLVITAREKQGGRLALALPLLRRRYGPLRVIEFADLQVSDYAAPVCGRADFEAIRQDPRSRHELRTALQPFDLLRIQKMREDSPAIADLIPQASLKAVSTRAYSARLDPPFEDWRAAHLKSTLRKELDKKRRQLGRKGTVRFAEVTDPAEIELTFQRMREFRQVRFAGREDGNDLLQDPSTFAFYLDLAQAGRAAGLTRTYALWLDGLPIAGGFGLVHRSSFLLVLTGSDLADYKNLSLGLLAIEDMVRAGMEQGDVTFDLTIGDEAYKSQFGTNVTVLSSLSAGGSLLGSIAGRAIEQPWAKRIAKRFL